MRLIDDEGEMIVSDFEWSLGFLYEIAERRGTQVTRQTSSRKQGTQPLRDRPQLYSDFADLKDDQDCLQFARHFGLLTKRAQAGAEEPIEEWRRHIKTVRQWMRALDLENDGKASVIKTANSSRIKAKLTSLDVELISGAPGERPRLHLRPRTLLDSMLLQIAQRAATGTALLICQQCGKRFEAGAAGQKRIVAKFCSPACRKRFNYERRVK